MKRLIKVAMVTTLALGAGLAAAQNTSVQRWSLSDSFGNILNPDLPSEAACIAAQTTAGTYWCTARTKVTVPVQQTGQAQMLIHMSGGVSDVQAGQRTTVRLRFTGGSLIQFNTKPFVKLYQNVNGKLAYKGDVINHSARIPTIPAGQRAEVEWPGQVPPGLPAGFYTVTVGVYKDIHPTYDRQDANYMGSGVTQGPGAAEEYIVGYIQVATQTLPTDPTDVTVFPRGNYVLPIARTF